jgi:hypothetical protein
MRHTLIQRDTAKSIFVEAQKGGTAHAKELCVSFNKIYRNLIKLTGLESLSTYFCLSLVTHSGSEEEVPLMILDNKARSEVISIETVVTLGGKALMKVLKNVKLSQLHPQLACTPNKQYR